MRIGKTRQAPVTLALALVAAIVYLMVRPTAPPTSDAPATRSTTSSQSPADGVGTIAKAFRNRTSGIDVEVSGSVKRVLPDDKDGDRHQRFLVRLSDGHTLLVAHNIDLAERVPIGEGDSVSLRGRYEWSDKGGTVHWTHHDPRGRHDGGWIRHEGMEYR